MNNYCKLVAKLNRGIALCTFWQRISNLALKVSGFALRRATKVTKKNIEVVGKLADDSYPQEFKDLYNYLREMEL
jgi:hypothetical protein